MEYLTTYGWAILIIALALAVVFSIIPTSNPSQQCSLPAGFSCINYYIAQNGLLEINLLQSTSDPIEITALGCNNPESIGQMDYPVNQPLFTMPVNVPIGANYSFAVQCYSGTANTPFFGKINSEYSGYLTINYTNSYTNFPSTVYGKLVVKVIK